jgi:5-keto 4-deoxyuronate isomerase
MPGKKFSSQTSLYNYEEIFTPEAAGLRELSCGLHRVAPGGRSPKTGRPTEEALLFNVGDAMVQAHVDGEDFGLEHYDVLYVPRGAEFLLSASNGEASLYEFRAPARTVHPPHHSSWKAFSVDEKRIRPLSGKDVYLMFDVSEQADRLMAGYTFFQPNQRGWPIHNHTDQEEVYLFIEGRGAMEVFMSEEEKTFVTGVEAGDAITIPYLAYHPPFSQDGPMAFIWCIAGERYWVGDKDKSFMSGQGESITT